VAFGHIDEQEAWAKISDATLACGLTSDAIRIYACFDDVRGRAPHNNPVRAARRKPSGTMIREACGDYPDAAALGVLMVGDRPEDKEAARDAGVSFQWAHIFSRIGERVLTLMATLDSTIRKTSSRGATKNRTVVRFGVVPPGRLERPTHGLGNHCSIH
jgi:HAD-hyrolase-like